MKRILWLLMLLLCGLSLSLFTGCSDDDDDNPLKEGDPESAEFQVFDEAVAEQPTMLSQYALFTTLALFDSYILPEETQKSGYHFATAEGEPLIVFDSVDADTSHGWFIFYFEFSVYDEGIVEVDTLEVRGTDSIRVFKDGVPVYILNDGPDSLEAREHFELEWWNNLGEEASGVSHYSLRLGGSSADSTVVNASSADSVVSRFIPIDEGLSLCSLMVATSTNIDDLVMNLDSVDVEEVCPSSGAMYYTLNLDLGCIGDSSFVDISGGWSMSLVFEGALQTITISNGEYQWVVTDYCGDDYEE